MNKYSCEVDEWEILPKEKDNPFGERLTKFNCIVCELPLSEADLFSIRSAHAPCKHYNCCFSNDNKCKVK